MRQMHQYMANKNVFSKRVKLFWPTARTLRTSGKEFHAAWPAIEKAHRTSWCDQESSPGESELLTWWDVGDWLAEVNQVLWSVAMKTVVHHDAELVCDSFKNIQPIELNVKGQPRS